MSIDKSWIGKPRNTHEYKDGLNKFLDFAFEHRSLGGRQIKCPCPVCGFGKWQTREKVFEHLIVKPFPENYKVWYWHGEEAVGVGSQAHQTSHIVQDDLTSQHPMVTMLNDAFGVTGPDLNEDGYGDEDNIEDGDEDEDNIEDGDGDNTENVEFYKLLEDGSEQLYEGCTKYSKLSFLISLYHIKCLYRISDKAMTEILKLIKDAFGNAKISNTFYEAKKTINKLGLNYTKIPACPNDCMLYWGEDEDLQECKRCKTSKWSDAKKKKPAKILRYFPLKPRLQRLFMCSKTAQSMRWHASAEKKDSKMRHPRDSEAWKTFDLLHDEYGASTRLHLLVKDVHNLPEGLRIVVTFDKHHAAIGEAAGLLAGVCGQLATDCVAFPISFEKWSDIPASFFENQWNIFFLARFCFKVSDNLAKRFLLQSLGKKWREHRIKLWNDFYDPRLSKTEIINNAPEDIAPDQWALFVEYRLKPETQKLCKRNQEIRQKQIIPHTSGAKSIARRRAELTEETGKEVSRVQMWDITHKKIDGSYVNEKAKEIAEKIEAHSSQQPMELTLNSPLDPLGVVFGKEHPGRVRGLGMGAVPTIAFKNNTTRISQMNLCSSNDVGTSSSCGPNVQEELDTVKAQLQALVSYIASKEGGKIPIQLAGMFPTQQVSQGLDQESEIPSPKELGSRSSGASNKEA